MKFRYPQVLSIAILFLVSGCTATPSDVATRPVVPSTLGIVVEEVDRDSVLEKAGLRPGDRLFAWKRLEGDEGKIRTVFDWLWVKTEQAPRGTVRLQGERNGVAVVFEVPQGPWDMRVRPDMAEGFLQTYTEGRRRIEAGALEDGIALWNQLAQSMEQQTAPGLKCWLLLQISEAWAKTKQGEQAHSALQAALAQARDAQTQVNLWEALGRRYELANEMVHAEASLRSALEAGETAWGESLQVASTMTRLGTILRRQNRLNEAAQLYSRALEIRQRWAPDSLEVIDSLHQLTNVASARGDLEIVTKLNRRALGILKQWPPDSLAMANILSDLAGLEMDRGLFEEATATLQRVLAILERRSPDSLQMATILDYLGQVTSQRGDTESAVELHQRALAIRERLAPNSLGTAYSLTNLGQIAFRGGDLARAAELYQRALAVWGKAAPQGLGVAGCLATLGDIAHLRGDLNEAWDLHRRALEIFERLAPDGRQMAVTLNRSGMDAEARNDLNLALELHQRALAILERLAPGTLDEALALQQLGRVYRRTRRSDQAAQFLARAVDALESQVGRLGGSQDLQATFRARHEEIYRDAIEVGLEQGRSAEAFHLVERSRARSFLALLSERDLAFSSEIPDALERSRRDNAANYDQTLGKLARWTPAAGEAAREALHGELSRLRRERDEVAAEIRKTSPRLAALRQPEPLDLAEARKVLDPGTLALSYSVSKEQTALFAVTREGGLRVKILPVGKERLRQDVERFLERIRSQEAPADLARMLYLALIEPVADLVERSERLLILPDGPLHRLPFGALIRDTGQYLAEWKPLHSALSLTVYRTLRASDRKPGSTQLVAFGDPHYPENLVKAGENRSLALRGFNWTALPYSRREVERIAEVYPGARLYLGEEATEERAKSMGHDVRILHFATHGHLDDRNPLDSALVLTVPEGLPAGRDNGLLQVWEIFESVRLDTDLVVLSACESALGRELSGEGLIGLTRAFQYAGARSVVATLWDVPDQTTAELMARFHHHLAAGLSKDEALRAAQIELIRQPVRITTASGQALETDASAPFFWAAFQLFGDWR